MVTMKAVLCISVATAYLAIIATAKTVDKKQNTINEKRSIELSPESFIGGLDAGVQLFNPGTSGLLPEGSVSPPLINPAISYDSGNALFGYHSSGYGGSLGGFGDSINAFTTPSINVGESLRSFGGAFGDSGSLGSFGTGVGASLTTGAGVVSSTTASPLPATTSSSSKLAVSSAASSIANHDTHEYRHISQKVPVPVPQPVPFTITRTIPVPQPYKVHVPQPYPVPVQVKVPVEVPKPYTVKVPQPVSVPVAVRVPVEIPRPYPVYKTKEVKVEVQKPVFIRVPVRIQVPVPQAYRVDVPTPYHVPVPQPVFLKDRRIVNTYSNGGTLGGTQGLYGLENYGFGGNFGGNFGAGNFGGFGSDAAGAIHPIGGGIPHFDGIFGGDLGGSVLGAGVGFGVTEGTLQGSTPSSDTSVSVDADSVTVEGRAREEKTGGSLLSIGATSSTESNVLDSATESTLASVTSETPTTVSDVEITSPSLL